MIKGKLINAGTMNVEGELLNGIFIECSTDELRNNVHCLYQEVEVRAASTTGAVANEPPTAAGTPCQECQAVDSEKWNRFWVYMRHKQKFYDSLPKPMEYVKPLQGIKIKKKYAK
jgi:hypothetical protein